MKKVTGRNLLEAAIGWYGAMGEVQIPSVPNGESPDTAPLMYSEDKFDLHSADGSLMIHRVEGRVFPFLAGVSMGFETRFLTKIIKDHGIELTDLTCLDFQNDSDTGILIQETQKTLTPTKVIIQATKAFVSDLDMRKVLLRQISRVPSAYELVGVMHTGESSAWPSELIKNQAHSVMTPSEVMVTHPFNGYCGTISAPRHADEIPNGNPLDLIRRTGLTTEPVMRKLTGRFDMWEDLVYMTSVDHEAQIMMMRAIAQVEDLATQQALVRGLLSISADSIQEELDPLRIYNVLVTYFTDQPAFQPVLDSLILKMNLYSNAQYRHGSAQPARLTQAFKGMSPDRNDLLSRVFDEMLARPANHLGLSDYKVFEKLGMMELAPQTLPKAPERLINHILDSLETYLTPNVIRGNDKREVDQDARGSMRHLIKLLGRHHDFEYKLLEHRTESEKVMLIKAGMDIRQFKGLSRTVRGQILEDDLGM
jgi:hypothetical protein